MDDDENDLAYEASRYKLEVEASKRSEALKKAQKNGNGANSKVRPEEGGFSHLASMDK
jgi:hypothetical protein